MNPSYLLDGVDSATNPELDYATSLVPSGGDPSLDLTKTTPPLTSRRPQTGDVTNGRALGDWDDILALTVRSESEPFVAQIKDPISGNQETIESNLAEVLWYANEIQPNNPTTLGLERGMRRIYRHPLLIAPWLSPWNDPSGQNRPTTVSVHREGNLWVPNTLGDLTKRENRFCRNPTNQNPFVPSVFPHVIRSDFLLYGTDYLLLDDALAFDVRVYDPGAPLYNAPGGAVVQPGDIGWPAQAIAAGATNPVTVPAGFGAYCDLGWNWNTFVSPGQPYVTGNWLPIGSPPTQFQLPRSAGSHPRYQGAYYFPTPAVYDTWSFHYENDGIDQDNRQADVLATNPPGWRDVIDQGTNGLDDDNLNGVDDPGERETSPPYDTPLRGIQVKFRVYERDARQIRETSVTHSFVE
jgi:hypothetical protein